MDEREFEQLDPKEQEKVFHESPLRDRGTLISYSHEPHRLVGSLSHEELYLLTREVDLEEKSEIIRYANLPQVFFISDIDCWKRDQIDPYSFVKWLETLVNADEDKLVKWMTMMDYETVIAGLRKVISVIKPEREFVPDDVLGDTPYFTLDEYYYIYVREEELQTVKQALSALYERSRGKYAAIMEGILGEVTDELEEEGFRRRSTRLAERGFPDVESAQVIYKPISEEEFYSYAKKSVGEGSFFVEDENPKAPSYPVVWDEKRFFLDDVLHSIRVDEPELAVSIQEEIAWIANKVIACKGLDFSSEKKVRDGVFRARAMASIGLEILSDRDLKKAKKIATDHWLETVFRLAVTRLRKLREKSHAFVQTFWSEQTADLYQFLNQPYDFIFQAAMQTQPQYWDPEFENRDRPFRDFESLHEILLAEKSIEQISQIHEQLKKHCKIEFSKISENKESASLTLFGVLSHVFISSLVGGDISLSYEGVEEDHLKSFSEKFSEKKGARSFLNREAKEEFFSKNFTESRDLMSPLWSLAFEALEIDLAEYEKHGRINSNNEAVIRLKGHGQK